MPTVARQSSLPLTDRIEAIAGSSFAASMAATTIHIHEKRRGLLSCLADQNTLVLSEETEEEKPFEIINNSVINLLFRQLRISFWCGEPVRFINRTRQNTLAFKFRADIALVAAFLQSLNTADNHFIAGIVFIGQLVLP